MQLERRKSRDIHLSSSSLRNFAATTEFLLLIIALCEHLHFFLRKLGNPLVEERKKRKQRKESTVVAAISDERRWLSDESRRGKTRGVETRALADNKGVAARRRFLPEHFNYHIRDAPSTRLLSPFCLVPFFL